MIMAFPSREYMYQEYNNDEEIQAFAASRNFPSNGVGVLMALGKVKGDAAPDVWKYMREETGSGDPSWNFAGKYLVDREGAVSVPEGSVSDAIRSML